MYLRRIGSLWSSAICLNTTWQRLTGWQAIQAFIQAPSTRIRIFLNPQLFLSGFKNFHVHTHPFSNRICPSTRIRIHSSAQDSSGNIGSSACVVKTSKSRVREREKTLERGCHLEYSIHGKELGWILLRHRKKKFPDLAFGRLKTEGFSKPFLLQLDEQARSSACE